MSNLFKFISTATIKKDGSDACEMRYGGSCCCHSGGLHIEIFCSNKNNRTAIAFINFMFEGNAAQKNARKIALKQHVRSKKLQLAIALFSR